MADQPMDALTGGQKARAQALEHARSILGRSGKPVDATDLVAVADWIIDGLDPWRQPTEVDERKEES